MHHNPAAPAAIVWMSPGNTALRAAVRSSAEKDRRWPALIRKLKSLRKRGRRSVRIVDAHCGAGELLIAAARRARALGFLAIEGRGIDADRSLIAAARRAAAEEKDPAIGFLFEEGDAREAMREEAEFPADLLLADADDEDGGRDQLARSAADTILATPAQRTRK